MDDAQKTTKIRQLNDHARQNMGAASRLMVTRGIAALEPDQIEQILERVNS